MAPMRLHPALLLLPLVVATGADGDVRLGCGFGDRGSITDADSDGFGDTIDCDDSDPEINPDADELCDGVDNDCDGELDENEATDAITWYWDADHDGWGVADGETVEACSQPDGYGPAGDCYDHDPRISPDATETCDGVDNDCDDEIDVDAVDASTSCADEDRDGYGDPAFCVESCWVPSGFVEDDADCDDSDHAVNPGAEDICDEIDNDCDGVADPQAGDADGDGWDGCDGDCGPDDPAVNPDADEVCGNGVDDDCDGTAGDCGVEGSYALGGAGLLLTSPSAYDAVGRGLGAVGDLDGDGVDDLAIGAPFASGAPSDHGAVYILHGGPGLRDDAERSLDQAAVVIRGSLHGDMLGWSVAGAGDVDGDDRDDLLLGAPWDGASGFPSGAAYLVAGAALDGVSGEQAIGDLGSRIGGGAYDDQLGWSLDVAGDVNGDGVADLLIGAPLADSAAPSAGAAYLILGPVTADLDVSEASARFTADALDDGLGAAVTGLGDIDGDGIDDLAVGAYRREHLSTDGGFVAVQLGHSEFAGDYDILHADIELSAAQNRAFSGCALDGAGDVDGDGYRDILVGARGQDYAEADVGVAFLVSGTYLGFANLDSNSTASFRGVQAYGYAGSSVAGPGDLDGDGFADVVIGAPYAGSVSNAGEAALFLGPVEGTLSFDDADASLDGDGTGRMLGERVAGAGDVDGDGRPDLLVAVPGYDQPSADAGAAWLLWGGDGL